MDEKILKAIRAYYGCTPLFLFLDLTFGIDVRIPGFLSHGSSKAFYYLFCFCCLGVTLWKPAISAFVGLLESSTNILILCLGVLLPIWTAASTLETGSILGPNEILKFVLAGSVCLSSFYGCVSGMGRKHPS